jgi:thiamine pyrophosphokinase
MAMGSHRAGGVVTNQSPTSIRAVLVANGPSLAAERMRQWVSVSQIVVGVDGGASRLLDRGIHPTHVMGDFDSLNTPDRRTVEEFGAAVVPLDDQNFTDIDKSVAYTIHRLGAAEIAIFGATGGRLDHTLAALTTIAKYGPIAILRLIDNEAETMLVGSELTLSGDNLPGRTLSLIALGHVHGVRIDGVQWPLRGERLGPGGRDGTSNVVVAPNVKISCDSGILLVSIHHPPL